LILDRRETHQNPSSDKYWPLGRHPEQRAGTTEAKVSWMRPASWMPGIRHPVSRYSPVSFRQKYMTHVIVATAHATITPSHNAACLRKDDNGITVDCGLLNR